MVFPSVSKITCNVSRYSQPDSNVFSLRKCKKNCRGEWGTVGTLFSEAGNCMSFVSMTVLMSVMVWPMGRPIIHALIEDFIKINIVGF